MPAVDANTPKVVWALDFQFNSTVDGRAVKIASMIDEHTRKSLLHLVERSITAKWLVAELEKVLTARSGAPKVLSGASSSNSVRPPILAHLHSAPTAQGKAVRVGFDGWKFPRSGVGRA
ncbi:hypothetical protein ACQP1O_16295 [Nocardia sp. CA-151230]|uniref:hypothetical protein n=1 Tax=Nocardia sp. CA-151230 TaxID=3239982 RepID=UPI003D8F48FF